MSVKVYIAIARKQTMGPGDDIAIDIFDEKPTEKQLANLCMSVPRNGGPVVDMLVHCRELLLTGQVERAFTSGNDAHTHALQSMFMLKVGESLDELKEALAAGLRKRPDAAVGLKLAIELIETLKKDLDAPNILPS